MLQYANGPCDPGAAGNPAAQALEMFHTALVSPLLLPAAYRQSFPEPLNLEVPGMLLRSALTGNPLSRVVPEAL